MITKDDLFSDIERYWEDACRGFYLLEMKKIATGMVNANLRSDTEHSLTFLKNATQEYLERFNGKARTKKDLERLDTVKKYHTQAHSKIPKILQPQS
ncbi:hypothetical protein ACKGJO_06860 [Gracilimonas sp. Q87]|uniref:hypothetical protein n=1 Tax=Gracilimonas sp. Q87 TaxID=3384766 RepID=UPI0039841689